MLAAFFWRLSQRHASIGYEWLVNCGRRDSTARVAHLLCETAARSGINVAKEGMTNPFTQQQIADITGQTSVNVNRVFADLERQGLISRTGAKSSSATGPKSAAWRASSRAIWSRISRRSISLPSEDRGSGLHLRASRQVQAWWARQGLNLRPHACEGVLYH